MWYDVIDYGILCLPIGMVMINMCAIRRVSAID